MSFPALVEPADELTIDEVRRYSRHLIIPDVGMTGQKRMKNAKVLVIGAGGLGSPALLYLAAAGVGTLGIAEFDTVDESNLQRQVIHGVSDIDKPKGLSAKESIAEINPYVNVVLHEERLDNDNVLQVFEGYDLIVDGTDNFATRYMVNDAAYFLKIPYVWGSIYRFDGQASVFWPHATDENGESVDAPCYRCLYPEPPPPGMVPSCAEGGVLGVLCASIGSIQVNEAIKVLTGIGDPAVGKLVIYDALELEWRKLKVRKDPNCALCGEHATVTELIDYDAFCGAISEEAADAAAGSTISVTQLEHMLKERDEGTRDFVLVDVREPNEYEINQVPGSVLIPKGDFLNGSALEQLPRSMPASRSSCTARPACARPRRSRSSRVRATATPCTSAAAWWPGSTRSTPASRRTDLDRFVVVSGGARRYVASHGSPATRRVRRPYAGGGGRGRARRRRCWSCCWRPGRRRSGPTTSSGVTAGPRADPSEVLTGPAETSRPSHAASSRDRPEGEPPAWLNVLAVLIQVAALVGAGLPGVQGGAVAAASSAPAEGVGSTRRPTWTSRSSTRPSGWPRRSPRMRRASGRHCSRAPPATRSSPAGTASSSRRGRSGWPASPGRPPRSSPCACWTWSRRSPQAVAELAALYREARFSDHELSEDTRHRASASLDRIHGSLGARR